VREIEARAGGTDVGAAFGLSDLQLVEALAPLEKAKNAPA
jgi:hypothetical protein